MKFGSGISRAAVIVVCVLAWPSLSRGQQVLPGRDDPIVQPMTAPNVSLSPDIRQWLHIDPSSISPAEITREAPNTDLAASTPGAESSNPARLAAPAMEAAAFNDPELRDARKAWLLAHYERQQQILREHERAFFVQGLMSYVVFALAHLFLMLAAIAAALEFRHAFQLRRETPSIGRQGREQGDDAHHRRMHEIMVSLEGVALKTSLHGTLLLVFALAFYYLFLEFVYPIEYVGGG